MWLRAVPHRLFPQRYYIPSGKTWRNFWYHMDSNLTGQFGSINLCIFIFTEDHAWFWFYIITQLIRGCPDRFLHSNSSIGYFSTQRTSRHGVRTIVSTPLQLAKRRRGPEVNAGTRSRRSWSRLGFRLSRFFRWSPKRISRWSRYWQIGSCSIGGKSSSPCSGFQCLWTEWSLHHSWAVHVTYSQGSSTQLPTKLTKELSYIQMNVA